MSRDMAFEMAEWKRTQPCLYRNVVQVEVRFGRRSYFGCRYSVVQHYTENMREVIDGSKSAGDEYFYERLDLIGAHPEKMKNRANFVFTFDNKEWFIVCYFPHDERTIHSPFGRSFMLGPWSLPEPIDYWDRAKRPRIPMTVIPQE